ncbi:JDVT-CTERM system glutamic-type intramembrane protease MrtJ [Duganella margarita]|uniref:JDVT-CTERM system glutamic-type intramembrane protease MrtJ n=1 Tax=Duganella margarita TaxID=2692170 RepID=UPI003530D284
MWPISEFYGRQLLLLLVLSPVLEEVVVRAGLQEWLMRRAPQAVAPPVLVSAATFGLLHLRSGWLHALAVIVPGLALALLYQRTRSWCWCAVAHSAMNAFAISVCGL